MSDHETFLSQSATVILMTLIACVLPPCLAMCEPRCEQASHSLSRLRGFWRNRYSNTMGEFSLSFETFLLHIIQDHSDARMRRLRGNVLHAVARYQDCVMACEHQFSKRQEPSEYTQKLSHANDFCQRVLFAESESRRVLTEDVTKMIAFLCSFLQKTEKLIS